MKGEAEGWIFRISEISFWIQRLSFVLWRGGRGEEREEKSVTSRKKLCSNHFQFIYIQAQLLKPASTHCKSVIMNTLRECNHLEVFFFFYSTYSIHVYMITNIMYPLHIYIKLTN